MTALTRRQEYGAAFAETDARIILFGAKAFEDDLVAILDKAALLAGRQRDRLAPARGELEEAAPAILVWPGHGARAEEIADHKIAAVAGVIRQPPRNDGRRRHCLGCMCRGSRASFSSQRWRRPGRDCAGCHQVFC